MKYGKNIQFFPHSENLLYYGISIHLFFLYVYSKQLNQCPHTVGYNEVKFRNGIVAGEGEKQRIKEAGC